MKPSPWYNSHKVKPIRNGWYECRCCNNRFWWNGKFFSVSSAIAWPSGVVQFWRGIIK